MPTRRSAPAPTLGIAALVLLAAGLGTGSRAQDVAEPTAPAAVPVPVTVTATIDAAELTTTGLFTIRLDFAVEEDVKRALALDVELTERGRVLLGWTHVPTPPPSKWRKGETVRCDLLAPFPTEAATGARLDVRMAFRDAAGALLPPRGASSLIGARVVVAQIDVPTFEPVVGEDRVQRILAAADELAKAGRKPDAWAALEFGVRGAPEDATKYRLRDAMTRLEFEPRPLTQVEERIVAQRIADERRRWLGDEATRLYGQKKLHAALRVLTEVGGMLEEDANAAVFGAAEHARLAKKDVHDLRLRIWERCEPAEKEQAEKALATLGRTRAALEKAKAWIRDGRFAPAWQLLKDLEVSDVKEVAAAARHEARALEQKILDAIPADEQKAADAALHHPAFARTTVSLSHQFVFIGPRTLVESIPPESKRALDLAYVFLTDLFGRRPNPEGDRVTVYFKELWEVGGAAADGNDITVGQARPDARGTAVDDELMFHELTHCVDDTRPIHEGFREGLGDFGAAYADEALARPEAASRAFDEAIRAFQRPHELAITFQGDGDAFGLSGCNVLLWGSRGRVAGQVERYDDVTYQWTPREAAPQGGPERESDLVVVTYAGRRLSVSVNGVPLLTDASIRPIPGKSRIGFATWRPDLRIASLTLESTSRRPVASQADAGLDIDFTAAAKLTGDDFEEFLDRVLARWRRAADATKRTQLFDGATSVGPSIVEPLIVRLDATDDADRAAAHALLRHATGLDFGYDPAAAPTAREEAVYWWQAWWMKSKPRLVFDPAARRLVVR